MSAPDWNPIVGDGATICHYSDRTACTVIRVSPSGDWGGNVDAIEIYWHTSNAPASGLPSTSRVLVKTGATLDVNGCNTSIGPLAHSGDSGGTVTNGSTGPATLAIHASSGTQTFAGLISTMEPAAHCRW